MQDERAPRAQKEKILYLITSASLDLVAESGPPASTIVGVWIDSIDEVYEHRVEAGHLGVVAFTDRTEVALRLELLGIATMVVDSPASLLGFALRYANNRAFYEQTRPESLRSRSLPQPFVSSPGKHVLIQVDDFVQGGLENVVLSLARGLKTRGMRVSLLVLRKLGPAAEEARETGLPVWTIPEQGREQAYERLLHEQKVDLINAHYSVYGAKLAHRLSIPFVQVVHNTYVWLDEGSIAGYREADLFTAGTLCVSAEVARYCDCNLGLSVSKMIVIPNGIDGRRLDAARSHPPRPLREELGLSVDDFVFLNVASIHATKGQKCPRQGIGRGHQDPSASPGSHRGGGQRSHLRSPAQANDPAFECGTSCGADGSAP